METGVVVLVGVDCRDPKSCHYFFEENGAKVAYSSRLNTLQVNQSLQGENEGLELHENDATHIGANGVEPING